MTQREIGPADILTHMSVKGEPGIYVLGCFERRVTLYSQQVRALNLVYALHHEQRLKPGDSIAIVGGSVAGMTAAAAAATLGYKVTLLEQHDHLLPLLRGNHSRWLHPHIYDWPEEGSEEPDAGLPLLDWKASVAGDVATQLLGAWDALPASSRITTCCNVTSIDLSPGLPRRLAWNADGPHLGDFAVVILAVGFGLEREVKNTPWISYWQDDALHQASLKGIRRHLISGCGDGGLVDLLRVRIRDFRHETALADFLAGVPDALRKHLLQVDEEARHSRNVGEFLFHAYKTLAVPAQVDAAIETRLRKDTEAVLNARDLTAFTLGACVINRFLVSRLLFRFGVEYRSGTPTFRKAKGRYEVRFAPGTKPEFFDHVTCRHGPSPSALEEGFPAVWEKCSGLRDLSILDQTRWPIFGGAFALARLTAPNSSQPSHSADGGALELSSLENGPSSSTPLHGAKSGAIEAGLPNGPSITTAPLLPIGEVLRIHDAAINAWLPRARDVLLGGMPRAIVDSLPLTIHPSAQLLSDLHCLNGAGMLADGFIPVASWLWNAATLAYGRGERGIFERIQRKLLEGEFKRSNTTGGGSETSPRFHRYPWDHPRVLSGRLLRVLHEAGNALGLNELRHVLLRGIDPSLTHTLPRLHTPSTQLLSDLHRLNDAAPYHPIDSPPMEAWLRNAHVLAGLRRDGEVFRQVLECLLGFGRMDSLEVKVNENRSTMPWESLQTIYRAAADANILKSRDALLTGISPHFVYTLPTNSESQHQSLSELAELNDVGTLADGSVPLKIWLENAALLATAEKEVCVFKQALSNLLVEPEPTGHHSS